MVQILFMEKKGVVELFKVFEDLLISNPSFYGIILTLLFGSSATAGGILFGIAFGLYLDTWQQITLSRTIL